MFMFVGDSFRGSGCALMLALTHRGGARFEYCLLTSNKKFLQTLPLIQHIKSFFKTKQPLFDKEDPARTEFSLSFLFLFG